MIDKLRNIRDVRYSKENGLIIHGINFRGQYDSLNILDLDQNSIYNIIMSAYEIGKRDAKNEHLLSSQRP
jgi:hypothetical protein